MAVGADLHGEAWDCSALDGLVLAEVRRERGQLMASQELDAEFISSGQQVFSLSSIDKAFESNLQAIAGF